MALNNIMGASAPFWLINSVANSDNSGPGTDTLTDAVHTVWYLVGFPDQATYNANISVVTNAAANAGGTVQTVTLEATYPYSRGVSQPQPGLWVIAACPTYLTVSGKLSLDQNLIGLAFVKLIADADADVVVKSNFHTYNNVRIFDATGKLIYNGSPTVGSTFIPRPPLFPFSPLSDINPGGADYTPQGLQFDGATGLVTTENLVTLDSGVVSFAGWFNIDPSQIGNLQFSNGNGSSTLADTLSPPTPGAWCHIMGTIDGGSGQSIVAVNGLPVPFTVSGTAFGGDASNGKLLYIGTDNQGNFYKGGIADLSIWFDFSFIKNGKIPDNIVGIFLDVRFAKSGIITIAPINPMRALFGFSEFLAPFSQLVVPQNQQVLSRQPDVFLSGPAATALTPILPVIPGKGAFANIPAILPLQTVTGTLKNSSTSPGIIEISPL